MESTHTPGPWKVVFPNQRGPLGDWHKEASPWVETSKGTPPIRQNVDHPGIFDAERLANARLIAAAPDLLAACEKMLFELRMVCVMLGRPETDKPSGMIAAEEAISKAKGGES